MDNHLNTLPMFTEINNNLLTIPWVEKYRPTTINSILLDPTNRIIFDNMIKGNSIPNLLFFGPPGTGKTTTIINLIKAYQKNNNQENKGLMIHLNASDERGVDTIRNQITQFINSKSLFIKGVKFVILDEVDYMTKPAQHALKYLIQKYNKDVRFCLICNYISKINESLQNDFLRIRFNKLPEKNIIDFLKKLTISENLIITDETLSSIQKIYKSDIRSMINYIQTNQTITHSVINNSVWDELINSLIQTNDYKINVKIVNSISNKYNIILKNIIKDFLNYIIRYKPHFVNNEILNFTEYILHLQNVNTDYIINYFCISLHELLQINE
jgi:replication factor C subunit 3/5